MAIFNGYAKLPEGTVIPWLLLCETIVDYDMMNSYSQLQSIKIVYTRITIIDYN